MIQDRHTQHDVRENLILRHLDVTDSDTQAKDLLELELDGRADLSDLVGKVLGMGHGRRELASYVIVSQYCYMITTSQSTAYPWRDQDLRDEESA